MSDSSARPAYRLRAAWTLVLLTTLCAELSFTAVAVPAAWLLLPLLMVMYGAGVLLVREAAARVGAGWLSIVLLGLVYELAEDGIGLRALTSPNIYGAADWGLRAFGINWSYWVSQVGVHVVFSVLVPIMLTDLLFPAHRGRPYLNAPGLVGIGALAIVGVFGLRAVIAETEDPGYRTPWGWTVTFLVAMAVLAFLALRVLPRRDPPAIMPTATVPSPPIVGLVAGVVTPIFLILLLPPGLRPTSIFGDGFPLVLPVLAAALLGGGFAWTVSRWWSAPNWTAPHSVWLAGGILVGHTAFMMPTTIVSALLGAITIVAEVLLLGRLAHRLESRSASTVSR
ncbi:hypothetical protein [Nocardia nova]|uniref:hypothetical protein n=1 Tax=Nocardia nova TaxID=37330 RepID=UPI0033D7441E